MGIVTKTYNRGEIDVESGYIEKYHIGRAEWGVIDNDDGDPTAIKHGQYAQWHENGQLAQSGSYVNNNKHDIWRMWHDEGTLMEEKTYKDGKLDGSYAYWWKNGLHDSGETSENHQIEHEGTWVNGQMSGKWIWYYENGNIKYEGDFSKGLRSGTWTYYSTDSDGNQQVDTQCIYEDGVKTSTIISGIYSLDGLRPDISGAI